MHEVIWPSVEIDVLLYCQELGATLTAEGTSILEAEGSFHSEANAKVDIRVDRIDEHRFY